MFKRSAKESAELARKHPRRLHRSVVRPLSAKVGLLNGIVRESSKNEMLVNIREVRQYLHAGIFSTEKGDYGQALRDFEMALQLNPNCHQAWNNKGVCYLRMGDCNAAQRCFNKSIEIKPDYKLALINSNLVHYREMIKNDSLEDALVKLAIY